MVSQVVLTSEISLFAPIKKTVQLLRTELINKMAMRLLANAPKALAACAHFEAVVSAFDEGYSSFESIITEELEPKLSESELTAIRSIFSEKGPSVVVVKELALLYIAFRKYRRDTESAIILFKDFLSAYSGFHTDTKEEAAEGKECTLSLSQWALVEVLFPKAKSNYFKLVKKHIPVSMDEDQLNFLSNVLKITLRRFISSATFDPELSSFLARIDSQEKRDVFVKVMRWVESDFSQNEEIQGIFTSIKSNIRSAVSWGLADIARLYD